MKHLLILTLILGSLQFVSAKETEKKLTVYTSRKTHLIQPIFDAYKQKTGIHIEHVNGKAGALIQKLKQEGKVSPADMLITVDAGNLSFAAQEGLLEPIESKKITALVPGKLRGEKNQWVGLSLRARTLFYNKNLVQESDLKSYADLSSDKWQGKLCLRTSRKVYNQSLVASMIQKMGEKKTQTVVEGWVKNLAKPVFSSDTQLLKAVDKGTCHVGIANTYYLARLVKKGQAKNVAVFWPKAANGGVHVNVSGAGVIKTSSSKSQAMDFLEWLVTPAAQELFAGLNDEYPVNRVVKKSAILQKWGPFSEEEVALSRIGVNQKKAVMLMDRARYR